jgi:lysophospholipid acyltransferase (LPLAT)-like uncharacterized protein
VPPQSSKVYRFAPLTSYPWSQRLQIRLTDILFYTLIRIIGKTLRYKIEGWENFEAITNSGRSPIYAFFHEHIFAGTYFFRKRGIVVITSQSKDGEYIARFIQRLGYGSVRGSSTRGGVRALIEMIRLTRQGFAMGFTVDGPRGPRRIAKSGAVVLAKKTGNPLMPFVLICDRSWTLKSWDKMQIPKPFARVRLVIGQPIYVPAAADEIEIEANRMALQDSLTRLAAT